VTEIERRQRRQRLEPHERVQCAVGQRQTRTVANQIGSRAGRAWPSLLLLLLLLLTRRQLVARELREHEPVHPVPQDAIDSARLELGRHGLLLESERTTIEPLERLGPRALQSSQKLLSRLTQLVAFDPELLQR